ncbi:MAG: F0F1 ATP synthase subunit B' [Paracoccaceae bacterium]
MATEHAAAEHATGMPQLDFSTYPNQIFWFVVAFFTLYFILSRVAMPRIASVLEDRHNKIQNDLEKAADLRAAAERADAAYQQALADAKAESLRIAAEAKAAIQKDIEAAIGKADAEIAAQAAESEKRIAEVRASALKSIEEVARDTAGAIVAALMPAAADDAAVSSAVAGRLKG